MHFVPSRRNSCRSEFIIFYAAAYNSNGLTGVSHAMNDAAVPASDLDLPPGLPADWRYDRDLLCPKCQYNLRMRRTPRCPECGSSYTWQLLLNISCMRCGASLVRASGAACPECDVPLNWQALIEGIDPRCLSNYEYASHPIRAAANTAWQALLPGRFWMHQTLETSPNVPRLRRLLLVALISYLVVNVASAALRIAAKWRALEPSDPAAALIAICMPLTTAVMLPCFGPTLKRIRIRRDQVLRIAAYGMTGILWSSLVFLILIGLVWGFNIYVSWSSGGTAVRGSALSADLFLRGVLHRQVYRDAISTIASVISGSAFTLFQTLWWWPFLWGALRCFLKFEKHDALALFISTQLIGLFVIAILAIRYTMFGNWCVRLWPI